MSDQTFNNCLRCRAEVTDQEYEVAQLPICSRCITAYFEIKPESK